MTAYNNYTIELTFKSPIATPLQSDTIFGHICWAIRFLKWEKENRLGEFINLYDESNPPLLVSNGFPKGYLPKPILPPVTQEEIDTIVGKEKRIENSFKIKTIKKLDIIPKETFRELQKEEVITPEKLFSTLINKFDDIEKFKSKSQVAVVQHNTINRMGRKTEGGLYSQEETFFDVGGSKYEIYLKTNYFSYKELDRIFSYISEEGFGKDKSTGKGYFAFEIIEGNDLPEANKPNAFMTLSSYIPSENDPVEGYYSILHKFGKLGGLYAKGVSEVGGNPFKAPLIMFTAGSTFRDESYQNGKVYGSLLKKVHHNESIRHYAYAYPLGINIEDKNENL